MKKTLIIPLGENCIPRTILTRYGIKKHKIFGEKTYPFDFAVFGMKEITKSLKTDFKEVFDDLEFVEAGKNSYWKKLPECIFFYREKNIGKNDTGKLIRTYEKRFKNFRKAMLSKLPVLFVQIIGDCEDIENQYKELRLLRDGRPFKIVVIDTQDIIKNNYYEDDIKILKLLYPSEEYKLNWWKKEYYESDEGKKFESAIAEFCRNIIENNF